MVKHIVIPTDFSDIANYAIDAGFKMSRFHRAKTTLLHVSDRLPAGFSDKTTIAQDHKDIYGEITSRIKALAAEHDAGNNHVGMLVKGGKFIHSLKDAVSEAGGDLIVMGSHGSSGINELLIGSNTQRVIRTLKTCALVVKNPIADVDFRNIVFSSSFKEEEQPAFNRFMKMFEESDGVIHLLSINTLGYQSLSAAMARANMYEFIKPYPHHRFELHIYPQQWIEPGIRAFATKIDADLVAIVNTNPSPLRRIFAGSTVESLINHSDLPILSISF